MDADGLDRLAGSWPGTDLSEPFGPGSFVWKVGGKIFAAYGTAGVSLKCRDAGSAELLIDLGIAEPAPYMKRGGWVRIRWEDEALGERLLASYETVRDGLPKKLRIALEQGGGA